MSWQTLSAGVCVSVCVCVCDVFFGLTSQVISAQQLPKVNAERPNDIVDPQVWVEIHGVAIDSARDKTPRVDNNGLSLSLHTHTHLFPPSLHLNCRCKNYTATNC